MVKVATCCMNCVYDKSANLKKYMDFIDEAASNGADLIVFPEQSLQAYLKSLSAMPFSDYEYQHDNAEVVPDGESTQALIAKAKEKNVYIIWGMTEKSAEDDVVMYNTMVLVGPEGFVGKYRKVHLPGDELHIYTAGTDFPVYDTAIGKIGMLICYDKSFPESARELAIGGAQLIVMSTAWPIADTSKTNAADVTSDMMYDRYTMYDRVRAIENQVPFISSNQFGKAGDIEYIGYSSITDGTGKLLATTGYSEGIAYAEFEDLKKSLYSYKVNAFIGLQGLKDRNVAAYKRLAAESTTYKCFDPISKD